jgi:hypothetical protein
MILRSWFDGFARVRRAPAVVGGVFVLTLVATLPLAITMRGAIESHLGSSLAANAAADAVDYDWWQEFSSQASGLGTTFSPAIIGFAATLDSLSSILDAREPISPIAGALATYLLAWLFLSGGILDRYARQRRTRAHGFFAACGVFFWRFLRLGIIAGALYWALFIYVHPWLLDDAYEWLIVDVSAERVAFLWRFGLYAVFGAVLVAVNIAMDYAKVRLVVEDRRSAVGALSAALGFLGRNAGRAFGLYGLNAVTFLGLLAVWARVAPGAGGAGLSMWVGFAATQIYLVARLALKLQFMASQTALFQRSLAHSGYTAAPMPAWPESPAAETIIEPEGFAPHERRKRQPVTGRAVFLDVS